MVLLHGKRLLVLRPAVRDKQRVIRITSRLDPLRLLGDGLHLLVPLRRLRVGVAVLDVTTALGSRWRQRRRRLDLLLLQRLLLRLWLLLLLLLLLQRRRRWLMLRLLSDDRRARYGGRAIREQNLLDR